MAARQCLWELKKRLPQCCLLDTSADPGSGKHVCSCQEGGSVSQYGNQFELAWALVWPSTALGWSVLGNTGVNTSHWNSPAGFTWIIPPYQTLRWRSWGFWKSFQENIPEHVWQYSTLTWCHSKSLVCRLCAGPRERIRNLQMLWFTAVTRFIFLNKYMSEAQNG